MQRSIEELSLKAVFSIGKQDKCLLLPFCTSQNFKCDGQRIPWCPLERTLMNGCTPSLVSSLKKEKVIKVINEIHSHLGIRQRLNPFPQLLEGQEKFVCPFFKEEMDPCDFQLCPYYSPITKRTSCLLSTKRDLQLSEISISKNVPKNKLLELVFSIEAGNKWETVKTYIIEMVKTVKACPHCGYFLSECQKDIALCNKRKSTLKALDESLIPEEFKELPIAMVILATHKVFGNWAKHLFPKKALKTYIDSLYQ